MTATTHSAAATDGARVDHTEHHLSGAPRSRSTRTHYLVGTSHDRSALDQEEAHGT